MEELLPAAGLDEHRRHLVAVVGQAEVLKVYDVEVEAS